MEKKELNIWKNQAETEIPDIDEGEEELNAENVDAPALVTMNVDSIEELRRKINPSSANLAVRP